MMSDKCSEVRKLALSRLLAAREVETGSQNKTIRHNIVLKLNLKAKKYYEMIDWSSVTMPPVLRHTSNEELISSLFEVTVKDWDFVLFPSHTVAVERTVKVCN